MSWPEEDTTTTCPYKDYEHAERCDFNACGYCEIPEYACDKDKSESIYERLKDER